MSDSLKHVLYQQCEAFITHRLQTIQKSMREIQESLTSETKSSAGDKHETGRAMMQLEREKTGQQLAEVEKVSQILSAIGLSKPSKIIKVGSIVWTTKQHYFIAISAGALTAEDQSFFAISASTPIAKLLMGKTVGDQISFRDQKFKIIKVF